MIYEYKAKVGDIVIINKGLSGVPVRRAGSKGKILMDDRIGDYPFLIEFANGGILKFKEDEFFVISNNKLAMELYK